MKAFLVLVAAITFAAAPFFSPEFGGFDPDRYPIPQISPPVQPAGWAFSIWGLIYLGLIIHASLGAFKYRDDPIWNKSRFPLFISLAIGTFWLPVALVSPVWATVMIWIMLLTAMKSAYALILAEPKWITLLPVSLYAGWLSAASFVSIGLLLAGYGFLAETSAAIIALVLATAFTLFNQAKLRYWGYGIAVLWASAGVFFANFGNNETVTMLAASTFVLLGLVVVIQIYKRV